VTSVSPTVQLIPQGLRDTLHKVSRLWPFKCCAKIGKTMCLIAEDDDTFSLKLSWTPAIVGTNFSLKACIGPKPIGKAHGTCEAKKTFRLTKIGVYEPYRKNGYGTIMINTLIGAAKTKKCAAFIFEGVSDTNVSAIKLYKSLGAKASSSKLCKDKTDYELSI